MTDHAHLPRAIAFETSDEIGSNTSANPTIGDVFAERLSRRDVMLGMLATSTVTAAVSPLPLASKQAHAQARRATPSFNFDEVAAGSDQRIYVAEGYDADVLIRWGDKVLKDALEFDPQRQTAAAQAKQFGYNNDFLGYIPLDGSSEHGLLVVNHEYTNEELMFPGLGRQDGAAKFAGMTRELAALEKMAHGGSVLEIRKTGGKWVILADSRYARRITADTDMRISGPAAGHELMATKADPSGANVRGMLNNCAGAITPWGTWLSCEENFHGYFRGKPSGNPNQKALERYGAPGNRYNWGVYHERFDIDKEPNEINRFGWVVEIDPMDRDSVPIKRTAMGRFKHEGAGNVVNGDGRFVVYSGDDEPFEYVYKFVTDGRVDLTDRSNNRDLLDRGKLYVAKYNSDGSGEWLPLVFGNMQLTAESGFKDQADLLINVRLAADLLGATKMDRPEDIEVNRLTNKVYVMLTNNKRRRADQVDPANPRADNRFGHIIEMVPDGGDHASTRFRWEILIRCGDPSIAAVGATFNPATTKDGWFGMPDNAVVDSMGRLWIATDGNGPKTTGRADGVWALELEGDARGTSKLFFRCPNGAELCGPEFTPDLATLFVAIQHPGVPGTFENPSTRWPDFKADMPPRPSVVAITKRGGGKIAV